VWSLFLLSQLCLPCSLQKVYELYLEIWGIRIVSYKSQNLSVCRSSSECSIAHWRPVAPTIYLIKGLCK
jgi:hypothetical protein